MAIQEVCARIGIVTSPDARVVTGLELDAMPDEALVQVLDGQARITISGKGFEVGTGQAIILPANQPHAVQAPQKFKMLLTMIHA